MTLRLAALAILLSLSAAGATVAAPVPKDQLMVPPPDAQHYVIASESNTHGSEWRWKTADGAIALRKSPAPTAGASSWCARSRSTKQAGMSAAEALCNAAGFSGMPK